MDAAIGIDPDQVIVERGVMDLRKGDAVGDDRLAEKFIGIGHDVRCIEEMIIRLLIAHRWS